MPIRAVAFDLDGTLYPAYAMYLRSIPVYLRYPRMIRHFGAVRKLIRKERPLRDLKSRQAELLAALSGISVGDARDWMERVIYGEWERCFRGMKPYRRVRETLVRFRGAGLVTCLLSDFPIGRKPEYLGLDDLFDVSMCSEDTGYLKPNPEPFEDLVRRSGFEPRDVLYVGNHYKYDIAGARACGLMTAQLSRRPAADSVADITFFSYDTLADEVLGERIRKN